MKAYLKKYKWALCLLVIFAALCWVYKTHYSTKSYPTVLTYHAIEEKLPEETSEENEYLFVRPADLEEQLQLLSTDGMLVKRPILVGEDFVLVGFRQADWDEKLP